MIHQSGRGIVQPSVPENKPDPGLEQWIDPPACTWRMDSAQARKYKLVPGHCVCMNPRMHGHSDPRVHDAGGLNIVDLHICTDCHRINEDISPEKARSLWARRIERLKPRKTGAFPPLWKQILGLLDVILKAASRMLLRRQKPTVSSEVYELRLRTCNAPCPALVGIKCRECGCLTQDSARLKDKECPRGLWEIAEQYMLNTGMSPQEIVEEVMHDVVS